MTRLKISKQSAPRTCARYSSILLYFICYLKIVKKLHEGLPVFHSDKLEESNFLVLWSKPVIEQLDELSRLKKPSQFLDVEHVLVRVLVLVFADGFVLLVGFSVLLWVKFADLCDCLGRVVLVN